MKNWLIATMLATSLSTSVFAAECGEAPLTMPSVPDGASATAESIRSSRDAVLAYSTKVDAYLACMDNRSTVIQPYLTKEQKARWDEDLATLHNNRRDLQTKMNEAIRAYRKVVRAAKQYAVTLASTIKGL